MGDNDSQHRLESMSEKRNILFVDDEANVLQGLKRLLHPMRKVWNATFCQSAQDALATMAERSFDVIVSDMRMPGMDGAALLNEVMLQYPNVVRIILSGHSSKEASVKSAGVAHQFLAKPCNAATLKRTIEHAFALRNILSNERLKQVLSQLESVPSIPALYEELMDELRHPDASTQRVGDIIAQDMGMTTKVLQLVNSAFFGLPRHVATPAHAAALLGVETIKALVLSIDVFSQFEGNTAEGVAWQSVQRHSAATAALAKQIAQLEKAPQEIVDASLMAGFLHDVGKLILAQNFPEQYGKIMICTRESGTPLCDVERDVLGTTHAEVGAYLLGLWGLPEPIVEATAFHHYPRRSFGEAFSALTAVHVANVFTIERVHVDDGGTAVELDLDYLTAVGVADRVATWRTACQGVGGDGENNA